MIKVEGKRDDLRMQTVALEVQRTGVLPGQIFDRAVMQGLPVALWRSPGEQYIQGIVGLGGTRSFASLDFRTNVSGFAFAPFRDDQPLLLIPGDLLLRAGRVCLDSALEPSLRQAGLDFVSGLRSNPSDTGRTGERWHVIPASGGDRRLGEQEFRALVTQAVELIHQTGIAKVVVSRSAAIDLPQNFSPVALFESLCGQYEHAFVSLVSIPGAGTWLGATPELLMSVEPGVVTTMALAGTQPLPASGSVDALTWGEKERLEQQMVSDYVRAFFVDAGVQQVVESGPRTVVAGSVVHLQTNFRAQGGAGRQEGLSNAILERLHPTSAVCGMPRREALAFITAREGYDRAYYSGYLGPVQMDGSTWLWVNLRCMQIQQQSALLYVGAGITADSDAESEWRETELKSRTLLDVIGADALSTSPALHTA